MAKRKTKQLPVPDEKFASLAVFSLLEKIRKKTYFQEIWPLDIKPLGVISQFAVVRESKCTLYQIKDDGSVEKVRDTEFIWTPRKVFFSDAGNYFGRSSKIDLGCIDWINKKGVVVFSWYQVKPSDVEQLEQRLFITTFKQSDVAKSHEHPIASEKKNVTLCSFIVHKKLTQGQRKEKKRAKKISVLPTSPTSPTSKINCSVSSTDSYCSRSSSPVSSSSQSRK